MYVSYVHMYIYIHIYIYDIGNWGINTFLSGTVGVTKSMSHPRLQAEPSRGLPLRLQLKTVIFPWLQCGKWLWSSNMGPVFPTQQSCFSVNCL